MLYIMTSEFYNQALLICIVSVFTLANCRFAYDMLYLRRALPVIQEFPGYYLVGSNMLWLSHESGRPLVNGRRHVWSHENHDGMDKMLQFCLLWIYLVVLQILYIVLLFPLWIVFYSSFLAFWFVVGLFLYQTKLFAMGKLRNMWFSNWTQSDTFNIETSIDIGVLNESTFYQFLLETAPQLVLQITNGYLSNSISSPPSIFSITFSVLITSNGLYRYVYYLFWKKVSFDKIPMPLALTVTNIANGATNITVRQLMKTMSSKNLGSSRNSHTDYKLLTLTKIEGNLQQLGDESAEILFLIFLTLQLPEVVEACKEVVRRLDSENVLREVVAEMTRLKEKSSIEEATFQQLLDAVSVRSRDRGYQELSEEIKAHSSSLFITVATSDPGSADGSKARDGKKKGRVETKAEHGVDALSYKDIARNTRKKKGRSESGESSRDSIFEQANPMHAHKGFSRSSESRGNTKRTQSDYIDDYLDVSRHSESIAQLAHGSSFKFHTNPLLARQPSSNKVVETSSGVGVELSSITQASRKTSIRKSIKE